MSTLTRTAAVALCAGLCAGPRFLGSSPPAQETRPDAVVSPSPSPTPSPKPLVIPAAERNRKSPIAATPEAIAAGKGLFSSQCAMCHGARGDGKGDLALSLRLQIPDFTRAAQQKKRTDGELFYILAHGHKEMPAETRLTEEQRWQMILYLRSLAPAAPGPP
jgi:mono/diheme cytochrome c family protein